MAPPIPSTAEIAKKQQKEEEISKGLSLVVATPPSRVLKQGEFRVSAAARARWDKVGDPPWLFLYINLLVPIFNTIHILTDLAR